jgi:predicted dienelactone hydrolase
VKPEILELRDPDRPSWADGGSRPVRARLWHPASGGETPRTVVVSHGSGGAAQQMSWLAEPLADAGFLAVAVDHHGNNFVDGYRPEGFVRWWERPLDITFVLDELSARERIGPVGAAGFSLGGYTAAALLGARIDSRRFAMLLSGDARTTQPPPEYPNLVEDVREVMSPADATVWANEAGGDYADERVLAAFLICPAVAELLAEESLAAIERPVAVRWAGADDIAPPPENAEVYARLIPSADGRSVGAEVGHYAFLADNPEFAEIREQVASEAVAFFSAQLR